MSYTITITQTYDANVTEGKDWKVIGKKEDGREEYGYTPEITKLKRIEREVFKQIVEDIDWRVVVLAINSLIPDQKFMLDLSTAGYVQSPSVETKKGDWQEIARNLALEIIAWNESKIVTAHLVRHAREIAEGKEPDVATWLVQP